MIIQYHQLANVCISEYIVHVVSSLQRTCWPCNWPDWRRTLSGSRIVCNLSRTPVPPLFSRLAWEGERAERGREREREGEREREKRERKKRERERREKRRERERECVCVKERGRSSKGYRKDTRKEKTRVTVHVKSNKTAKIIFGFYEFHIYLALHIFAGNLVQLACCIARYDYFCAC